MIAELRISRPKTQSGESIFVFVLVGPDGRDLWQGPSPKYIPAMIEKAKDCAMESSEKLLLCGITVGNLFPEDLQEGIMKLEAEGRARACAGAGSFSPLLIRANTRDLDVPWDLAYIEFKNGRDYLRNRFATGFVLLGNLPTGTSDGLCGAIITHPSKEYDDRMKEEAQREASQHRKSLEELVGEANAQLGPEIQLRCEAFQDKGMEEWLKVLNGEGFGQGKEANLLFFMGHWESAQDSEGLSLSYQTYDNNYETVPVSLDQVHLGKYSYPVMFLACCTTEPSQPQTADTSALSQKAGTSSGSFRLDTNKVNSIARQWFAKGKKSARAYIAVRGKVEATVVALFARNLFEQLLRGNKTLGAAFMSAQEETRGALLKESDLCNQEDARLKRRKQWESLQPYLFTVYCADDNTWSSRAALPGLKCTLLFPAVNTDYYSFYRATPDFDLPATIVYQAAQSFDEVCQTIRRFATMEKKGHIPCFMADVTVLGLSRLKAEKVSNLVVIGTGFSLGGKGKQSTANLFIPFLHDAPEEDAEEAEGRQAVARGRLREDLKFYTMDELASIYVALLAIAKKHRQVTHKVPDANSYITTYEYFTPTTPSNIRRYMEKLHRDRCLRDSMRPFLLFSSEDLGKFFSCFKGKNTWRQYFFELDAIKEFWEACENEPQDILDAGRQFGLPVQFYVTTKASACKYRWIYAALLKSWREWREKNAKDLSDDVAYYPPEHVKKVSKWFVEYAKREFSDAFSFPLAELDDGKNGDFDLLDVPEGGQEVDRKTIETILDSSINRTADASKYLSKPLQYLGKVAQDGEIRLGDMYKSVAHLLPDIQQILAWFDSNTKSLNPLLRRAKESLGSRKLSAKGIEILHVALCALDEVEEWADKWNVTEPMSANRADEAIRQLQRLRHAVENAKDEVNATQGNA